MKDAPLAYITCDDVVPDPTTPALAVGQPYSAKHGLVKGEMIAGYMHAHPLYGGDNGRIFNIADLRKCVTKFAMTVVEYRATKDGRGASLALCVQCAGPAIWNKARKEQMEFLMTFKYIEENNHMAINSLIGRHCQAYQSLVKCVENIPCQLSDGRTQVGFVLEKVGTESVNVKAVLAAITINGAAGRLHGNFKQSAALLIPVDLFKEKKAKCPTPKDSAAEATERKDGKRGSHRGSNGAHKIARVKIGV